MGLETVVKDYGTDILDAIRENNLKRLRSILDKQLRTDQKIRALCVTDIRHRPTKKFACPLILAARQEDPAIIRYMLSRGVDPNFVHHTVYTSKRRETVTALHIAVDLQFYGVAEALLNANANPNLIDHNDETPLHVAVKKADRVMTRMLLAKGANPSIVDRRANAPLHIATLYGHLQMVKTLLKHDADVFQKGANGAIPSHIAAREGHIHLIQVFCARDSGNINVKIPCFKDAREVAPLHLAAENGHVETVIALLDQFHADVNLRDSAHNTALHCVVLEPYNTFQMRDRDFFYATAKVLVRYHVSINGKNKRGNTALHLAASNNHPKIVELLLTVGANPFIENDDRAKPVDLVPESDSFVRQLLKSAMSNPRPAALDPSMVSFQHDLQNLSIMPGVGVGQTPQQTSTLRRSGGVPNGVAPHGYASSQPPRTTSSRLHRSISGTSSVFAANETRPRHSHRRDSSGDGRKSAAAKQLSPDPSGELAMYANVKNRDLTVAPPGLAVRSPISPIEPVNRAPTTTKAAGHRGGAEDRKSSRHGHHKPESSGNRGGAFDQSRDKKLSDRDRSLPLQSRGRNSTEKSGGGFDGVMKSGRHRRSASADRHSQSFGEEGTERHRRRREKSEKTKPARKSYDNIIDHLDDEDEEEEEYGVRVHTVPGKPSTIAVEYAGGPIVIAVDAENEDYEERPQTSSDSSEDSDSETSQERGKKHRKKPDRDKKKNKKKKTQKDKSSKRRHKEKSSDEEEDELDDDDDDDESTLTKIGYDERSTGEPIYSNQIQIHAEKERLEQQLKAAEEQKLVEEDQAKLLAEKEKSEKMERKRLRREERERRKALKREENDRRREKKLQRRLQRQNFQEPDAPTVLDAKPVVIYPSEVLNEPDYDSDELETEQLVTMQRVKQKAADVATNLIDKWRDIEDDADELKTGQQEDTKLKKRPRPEISPGNKSFGGGPDAVPSGVSVKPGSSSPDDGHKFESSAREIVNEVKVERAIVSRIMERGSSSSKTASDEQKKWVDAKIIEKEEHFVEEPIPDDSGTHHLSSSIEEATLVMQHSRSANTHQGHRSGLKLRVTGDVPKAYSRAEKDSARRAFMLAPPVGIESSSEASDGELSVSRGSAREVSSDRIQQQQQQLKGVDTEQLKTKISDQAESRGKPIAGVNYAKPYKSFGKIEPKTDALDEAMLENAVELKMEEFWKQSKLPKSVAQVSRPLVVKPQTDPTGEDSSSSSSDSDEEKNNSTVKRNGKPDGLIQPKKVTGTPTFLAGMMSRPDLLPKTSKPPSGRLLNDLSRSSDTLSYADDLEQYEEEPSFRRPSSRSMSRDSDLEDDRDFEDEPVRWKPGKGVEDEEQGRSKKREKRGVSDQQALESKDKLATGDSRQKHRKHKQTGSYEIDVEKMELEEEMRYKVDSKASFKVAKAAGVPSSPILSVDVWKEAMAGKPLASSEAFEPSTPSKSISVAKPKHRIEQKQKSKNSDPKRPDLRWNPGSLLDDEDLSRETLDDLSYSSYIMTQNLIANGWDENYNETNLDEFVAANETPVKVLEVRARDTSKSVVGRRQQRAVTARSDDSVVVSERWTVRGADDKKNATGQYDDEGMSSNEELKQRDEPEREVARSGPRRSSGAAVIPITAVGINGETESALDKDASMSDEDEEPYYNDESRLSKSSSVQLWQDESDEEEHMYACIDSDLDRLPSSSSLNKPWDAVPSGKSSTVRQPMGRDGRPLPLPKPPSTWQQKGPMRRIIPPLSPARSVNKRAEPVDDGPQEVPSRLKSVKAFVRGEPGSFRRAQVRKRSNQRAMHDAYASESEASRRPYPGDAAGLNRSRKLPDPPKFGSRDIYSEAEASDFEGPPALQPGKSVKQSALEALNAGPARRRTTSPYRSMILIHPGHHDKNFNHIRRMLRPKRKRYPGLTCTPSAGRYGDSALDGEPNRLRSGSETEPDVGLMEFAQYDVIARLWMERVRAQSVHKCSTMFLSLLPPGDDLPRELTAGYRQSAGTPGCDPALPPQWVMARSRTMGFRQASRSNDFGDEEELGPMRPSSPNRQTVLFFKVGGNWMDIAWVLFDGLQTDPETVRMIRDIQLKNPDGLAEQMHDLMHRWWTRRGRYATIEQLQRALDAVHIAYIHEEFNGMQTSVIPYSDTEDELDVGNISNTNPNVSHFLQEYDFRSLNATMNIDSSVLPPPPPLPENPPPIVALLKQKTARAERQRSGSSRLDSSSELRPVTLATSDIGLLDSGEDRRKTAVVHPQPTANLSKGLRPFRNEVALLDANLIGRFKR